MDRLSDSGTLLELAVLGMLNEQPAHGYELRHRLEGLFGDMIGASWGTLYPTLGRLERAGLISATGTERKSDSPRLAGSLKAEFALTRLVTGERNTRSKKVYTATARGSSALAERLMRLDARDRRAFWVGAVFAPHVDEAIMSRLLTDRILALQLQIRQLDAAANDISPSMKIPVHGLREDLVSQSRWCKECLGEMDLHAGSPQSKGEI